MCRILVEIDLFGKFETTVPCLEPRSLGIKEFRNVLPEMTARERSRDNAVYEAENDQLIGRLIEIEKLQGVIRLLQTQIVLLEWLVPLLEDVRISRSNLDIIMMLKDNLLGLELELHHRSCEVRGQILARYHRTLDG